MGFCNVTVTAEEKDDLDRLISELKPKLLMIEADFYQAGTPYMAGKLQGRFPKLNIAAVAVCVYPLGSGAGFIWKGIKSYASLREGYEEFLKGLQLIREGKEYVSPLVRNLINRSEWPDADKGLTERLWECLILLCCGFTSKEIGELLHISRKTVHNDLNSLYKIYGAKNREEMVAMAWTLDLVTKNDIRFYREKSVFPPIPEWAATKKKADNKKLRFPAAHGRSAIRNKGLYD
jgi:DNA-binding CsgD family transcriptional regulator